MAVETATFISELDATKPGVDDPRAEGDDHLRLLKSVLKAQFPNMGAAAATPTATEFNRLVGLAGNIIAADAITRQLNRPISLRFQDLGTTNTPTFDFATRGVCLHACSDNVTVTLSNLQPGAFGILITENTSASNREINFSGATVVLVNNSISPQQVGGLRSAVTLLFAVSTTKLFALVLNSLI